MAAPKAKLTGNVSDLSKDDIYKAIKAIRGSQSIFGAEEITQLCSVKKIRTDIPTLDYMGGGGVTEGGITILAGAPSAGKTTLSMMIERALINRAISNNDNRVVLHFDVERAFDASYALTLKLNIDKTMVIKRTNVIEEAFKEADDLISMGFVHSLVIDSLDNMVARKVEDNAYNATMGGTAGALAQHLPKLHAKIIEHSITTLIIKQARVKLDAYGAKGEVLTFSGGKALRHACDSIYIMKPLSNRDLDYTPVQIKAEKTRSPRMGLTLQMPMGKEGFDVVRDLVNIAIMHNLIATGGGGWMSYGDLRLQGQDKFVATVKSDDQLRARLTEQVYNEIINTNVRCESDESLEADMTEEG